MLLQFYAIFYICNLVADRVGQQIKLQSDSLQQYSLVLRGRFIAVSFRSIKTLYKLYFQPSNVCFQDHFNYLLILKVSLAIQRKYQYKMLLFYKIQSLKLCQMKTCQNPITSQMVGIAYIFRRDRDKNGFQVQFNIIGPST